MCCDEKLGHIADIKLLAWERSIRMVEDGNVAAIFTSFRTSERETFLDYLREIHIPQIPCLYERKGIGFSYNGDLLSMKDK